ncbi:MAG: dTTP/UTP pyrophosphatase [Chlamydiia bacterium]|nr:dTTP/UTP pyrophosphatase [Chlamydiia bacterium]
MCVVLGSQSPRRKEIFEYFDIPFTVCSSQFDESTISFNHDPKEYVETLSIEKAKALKKQFNNEVLITADTIVHFKKRLYPKPQDEQEAFTFLKELSGNTHEVYTGVCISQGEDYYTGATLSTVQFHPIEDEKIKDYIQLIDPLDKAGAYAIQGRGSLIVSKIEGCYYNVMGLPITLLSDLLKKVGIDLWKAYSK